MSRYTFGMRGSTIGTLGLALLLATGLTACKSAKSKNTAQAPVVDSGGGSSVDNSGGGTAPPAPAANQAPTLSGIAVTTAKTMQPFTYQPVAVDADGDKLTFDVINKPEWAGSDCKSGQDPWQHGSI